MKLNGNIRVKTERDIEPNSGIKTETKSIATVRQNPAGANNPKWNQEKQTLIGKISTLQTENQRLVLQLKKKEAELSAEKQFDP